MSTNVPGELFRVYTLIAPHLTSEQRSGIANANSPGYHTSREDLARQGRSDNYSIQAPADRRGPSDNATGIDITLNKAEMKLVTTRLRTACTPDATGHYDARIECIREFIGSLDGVNVCGYNRVSTGSGSRSRVGWVSSGFSDTSHRWHIHVSVLRDRVTSRNDMTGLAEVIAGLPAGALGWKGDADDTVTPPPPVEYPAPSSGEVYLDKLVPGTIDSDSVAYVQTFLAQVLQTELPRTGDYDPATVALAKRYQSEVLGDLPQYADGVLGKLQTIALVKAAAASVKVYTSSVAGGQVYPPLPPIVPPTKEDGVTLRVGTWNPYVGNSLDNMRKGFRAMVDAGADAIGIQELSDDAKQKGLTAYAKSLGWAATTRNSAVTIFWNAKRQELVRSGHTVVEKGGRKWESGAGGNDTIYKVLMEVELRERASGKRWAVLNHHLVPSVVTAAGTPAERFDTRKPIRVSVFKKQIAAARKRLDALGSGGRLVAITADWNVGWGSVAGDWVEAQLGASHTTVNWDEAVDQDTHTSDRTIDWVGVRNGWPASTKRLGTYGSDHNAVVVTITERA